MQSNTKSLPKSLQDDHLLTDHLKAHLNHICNQVAQTENRLSQLYKESSDFHLKLQEIENGLSTLKHKRYIQELIIEENGSRLRRQPETKEPASDAELLKSIAQATEQGLQLISEHFKPIAIQIPNQILNEQLVPNDIYEPIDRNVLRDLPPIIGSAAFASWNTSGSIEHPTETNEIIIGRTEQPKQAPKSQQQMPDEQGSSTTQASQVITTEVLKPSPIPQKEDLLNVPVEPKLPDPLTSKDAFITQLSERLAAVGNLTEKEDELIESVEGPVPVAKPRKTSPKPGPSRVMKQATSSSDEELFTGEKKKRTTVDAEIVTTTNPLQGEVPTKSTKKKSLLDESDDSLDELFSKAPKNPPIPVKQPGVVVAAETSTKTKEKVIEKHLPETSRETVQPVQPVKKPVSEPRPATIRWTTSKQVSSLKKAGGTKKRSIFDSSSSEEEEPSKQPTQRIDPTDEDMPKSVLNSVTTDFSSRLNQALQKRPSPSPSTATERPEDKPTEAGRKPTTPIRSSNVVEHKKQESVATLRGKLGDSIMKAHKRSTDIPGIKKDSSSSEENEVQENKLKESQNSLLQTLKAKPRPARSSGQRSSRPPIPKTDAPKEELNPGISKSTEAAGEVKAEETKQPVKKSVKKAGGESEEMKPTITSITSQTANKPIRKGLFDSSDSDDPF